MLVDLKKLRKDFYSKNLKINIENFNFYLQAENFIGKNFLSSDHHNYKKIIILFF